MLAQFPFTTSQTELNYYLCKMNVQVARQAARQLKLPDDRGFQEVGKFQKAL